jgi:hypothetical protein
VNNYYKVCGGTGLGRVAHVFPFESSDGDAAWEKASYCLDSLRSRHKKARIVAFRPESRGVPVVGETPDQGPIVVEFA